MPFTSSENKSMNVSRAIQEVGLSRVAQACGVGPSAVHRWKSRNRLPRPEYTGETQYAARIAALHGRVTVAELLAREPANS